MKEKEPSSSTPFQLSTVIWATIAVSGWACLLWQLPQREHQITVQGNELDHLKIQNQGKDNELAIAYRELNIALGNNLAASERLDYKTKALNQKEAEITKLKEDSAIWKSKLQELNNDSSLALGELASAFETQFLANESSTATLRAWAKLAEKEYDFDTALKKRLHAKLAAAFYRRDLLAEAKIQLELSENIDPVLSKNLKIGLELKQIFLTLEQGLAAKKTLAELRLPIEQAQTKLASIDQTTNRAMRLEFSARLENIKFALLFQLPVHQAIQSLQELVKQDAKSLELKDNTVTQYEEYLNKAYHGYQLSHAASNKAATSFFSEHSTKAIQLLRGKNPKHESLSFIEASMALNELDSLLIEGSTKVIREKAEALRIFATKAHEKVRVVFTAAANGHKAFTLFENGKPLEADKMLNVEIIHLNAFLEKHPADGHAALRLGILYWQKAQQTTKDTDAFPNLIKAAAFLSQSLQLDNGLRDKIIRQFSAMVYGDLGHLATSNKEVDKAKAHFTSALNHWKAIEAKWGKTEKTKEGIDFCHWRLSEL